VYIRKFELQDLSKYRTELMGVAAISIIFCHAIAAKVLMPNILIRVLNYGNLGVDLFLFLSGIGMFYSLRGGHTTLIKWYAKRFKRIAIPYIILVGPYWIFYCINHSENIVSFIYRFSTISYWLEHQGLWYVAMLIPLYLLTPGYLWMYNKIKSKSVLTAFIIIMTIVIGNIGGNNIIETSFLYNFTFVIRRLSSYFLGIEIGHQIDKKEKISLLYIFIMIGGWCVFRILPSTKEINLSFLLMIPISYILCMIFGLLKGNVLFKFITKMGQCSLESYLANYVCINILSKCTWTFGKYDLSRGNYIYYLFVMIVGTISAVIVEKITKKTT
jgi:hypothetical protein